MFDWNKEFDKKLNVYVLPHKQRKNTKITSDIVRKIVEAAKEWHEQEKTIHLKAFASYLAEEHEVVLSSKAVGDILVANDLRETRTRKKRPKFYQSLCQRIPNGLLSVDGSEFTVFLGDDAYKFNVESAVDVLSTLHTAFSVSDTETAEEVLKVIEEHRQKWGTPLGLLSDHGSGNLNEYVDAWLKKYDVEQVPAGPGNPKGNGTIEGSFGWLKRTIGEIRIDMSSKRNIAKSVLEAIISIYVKMHARLLKGENRQSNISVMQTPVDPKTREAEKERLQEYLKSKEKSDDSPKLNTLYNMIRHLDIHPDIKAFKRAETTIIHYDIEAIYKTEKIFIKAVSRKPERLNLAYFFGILTRIQQERDDQVYADYSREKYNYNQMLKMEKHDQECREAAKPPSIEEIIAMLLQSIAANGRAIRRFAMRRAVEWMNELKKTVKYIGTLHKKFMDAIAELKSISLEQKQELQKQIEMLLRSKTQEERVTQIS